MRYRIEKDKHGEVRVPLEAYYGIGAQRSKDMFSITKHGLIRQVIRCFAWIKKSAAKANHDCAYLDSHIEKAISLACDEIINGRFHGQFVTDIVQGSSGLAMNLNANEVIANRANELLGGEKGKYNIVHPENHVNLNQDSLNIVLMALKFSTARLTKKLLTECKKLTTALNDTVNNLNLKPDMDQILQEFAVLIKILEKDTKKITGVIVEHLDVNITIPGVISEGDPFTKGFIKYLTQYVGENIKQIKNPLVFERTLDDVGQTSACLKALISNVAKGAGDVLILHNNSNFNLNDEAIMSIEVVKQISFYVMGNDLTVQRSVESGELGSNIYIPIIFACIFEMINLIRRGIRIYRERVIEKIKF